MQTRCGRYEGRFPPPLRGEKVDREKKQRRNLSFYTFATKLLDLSIRRREKK